LCTPLSVSACSISPLATHAPSLPFLWALFDNRRRFPHPRHPTTKLFPLLQGRLTIPIARRLAVQFNQSYPAGRHSRPSVCHARGPQYRSLFVRRRGVSLLMYDHNEKAGNQGDVVKHTALIAAADALLVKCDGTFQYADTFAGYAFNPLRSDGEWRNGIGVLGRSGLTSHNYAVNFWRELWSCAAGLRGSVYPGSSAFILKLCLSKDRSFRARLWDTSPAVVTQLMNAYSTDEATIIPRPAEVGDFSVVRPHLLLIDPPGLRTQSKKDCPELADLLRFFDEVENAILWIPITAQGKGSPAPETKPSRRARSDCLARGLWVTSVRWSGGIRTCGCRLAYQLPSDAGDKLRGAVNDVATLMGWNPDWVTHDGPPNQGIYRSGGIPAV
jgi:23S rRNA A2030 N6-methylase RlmJ